MSKANNKIALDEEALAIEYLRNNPGVLMSYPEIFSTIEAFRTNRVA